jgi:oligopeptide/dipeptide ABC transporter ATP-binding protein
MSKSDGAILDVRHLKTSFATDDGNFDAVNDISFTVGNGETLGIVGESGSGKSVTALSVMQLLPQRKAKIAEGEILFTHGGRQVDIARLDPRGQDMRDIRGKAIAMIFQEPMTSLNPVFTIGQQIAEAVRLHEGLGKQGAWDRALQMLERVRIANPKQRLKEYPHQLSGGMRQRAMIAMALSCNPSLLIADEPTTALDVTIEAQILGLMRDLQSDFGMSTMIITHDLGVIGELADRVCVMYAGKIVETATTYSLFYEPKHPYTVGLLNSVPQIGHAKRLTPIEGTVPSMIRLPGGCAFAPRCQHAMDICRREEPPLFHVGEGQATKCWLHKSDGTVEAKDAAPAQPELSVAGGGNTVPAANPANTSV